MARTKKAEALQAARLLGRKGGQAGTGDAKRREGTDYAKLGASAWDGWTAEEISEELRRRARVRKRNAAAKLPALGLPYKRRRSL